MTITEHEAVAQDLVTVRLEKIRLGLQTAVSSELLDPRVAIDQVTRAMAEQIVFSIRGYIWGEKNKRVEIVYPRDWWQALKARFFPAWALRRWPAISTHHVINVQTLYPQLKFALPDEEHTLFLATQRYDATRRGQEAYTGER